MLGGGADPDGDLRTRRKVGPIAGDIRAHIAAESGTEKIPQGARGFCFLISSCSAAF